MSRPIGLMDVKQALRDSRFHESLPIGFREDLQKYLNTVKKTLLHLLKYI